MNNGGKDTKRAAHRQGDVSGGTASPAIATGGSPNVFINGRPAMREGDAYEDGTTLVEGSKSVFINGKPAGRSLAATSNGGIAFTGSPNVFIGDREVKQFSANCRQAYGRAREQARAILTAEPPEIYPEGGINTNRERNMINRYMKRNRLINEAYSKLYQDWPDNRWVGIAAIVSSQMGCNMRLVARKYTDLILKTIAPYHTYVLFPNWIEALGEGNKVIFEAMYPALRTAADQGYEQRDVAQPIYEKYAHAFGSLAYVTDMSATIGVDLKSVPLSRQCGSGKNRVPFTKDLTNADDRIDYFRLLNRHWDAILD